MTDDWPYRTAGVPPIPAAIKRRYEDFTVDEVPAYEPCGRGDHVYFRIEKTGLATRRAVNDIARALGVAPRAIGVAGLKDARGVTRQMLSLEHVDPARVQALSIPRIKILSVSRHTNRLRIGHLRANRFIIKLRETDRDRVRDVHTVMDVLMRGGVPNYFGPQRFGLRGDTWRIGGALLRQDYQTAVDLIAGTPGPLDHGSVLAARRQFAAKHYERAAAAWPAGFRENKRVCGVMARTGGNPRRAVFSVGKNMLSFYVSAYQSWLFNAVVAGRIESLNRVQTGDLAYKHDNGAVFRVEDADAEQPRAERFDISPTGPLFGHRMTQPKGLPAQAEQHVLDHAGLTRADFPKSGPLKCAGGRRPLRFQPQHVAVDAGVDDAGGFIELRFTLASGCYATAVLREICKDRLQEGLVPGNEHGRDAAEQRSGP